MKEIAKKWVMIILTLAIALSLFAGCKKGSGNVSPSPAITLKPAATSSPVATKSTVASPSPIITTLPASPKP